MSIQAPSDRRSAVLESALGTFARFGYRKTSMEEVARAAHISRPGLYFLFASKEELFRAAVSQALEADVAEVSRIMADSERLLRDRLVDAFDRWAGRYVGPMTRDIQAVIDENPGLLGDMVDLYPRRFAESIARAIVGPDADALTQTLISVSIGIKHQVEEREQYRKRFAVALDLLLR